MSASLHRIVEEIEKIDIDDDTIVHRDGEGVTYGELSPEERAGVSERLDSAVRKLRADADRLDDN